MPKLEILQASMTLAVSLSDDTLQQQLGDMVLALGPGLAQQVHEYVRRERLGYYPPLDYFADHSGAIDADLLSAAQHVAWLVGEYVRRLVQKRLREPFSNVRFEQTQTVAFSMPRVRPQDGNAVAALARHYAPNRLRLVMVVSSVEHAGINIEGYENLVRHKAMRWLENDFTEIEITDARMLAAADT